MKKKILDSEEELVDSLSCDELCVFSKKSDKKRKKLAKDKLHEKDCNSCSIVKTE